jgi:hypothetical protein
MCALLALAAAGATAQELDYRDRVAALARAIEAEPRNAALARAWEAERARVRRDPALYRTHPETGADLAALDGWLGVPVRLVATDELGTVEANAARVVSELRGEEGAARSILFSASKGSAEVRSALESDPALGERVPLWIDLVGVLEGTPLLDPDAGLEEETAWLPPDVARSLSAGVRRRALAAHRFPASTRAVHVAAFPEPADVSERARRSFERLRGLGPNDGYVLLDAYLRAPGRVLIEHGVDHYLAHASALDEKLLALLRVLLEEVGPVAGGRGDLPPSHGRAAASSARQ